MYDIKWLSETGWAVAITGGAKFAADGIRLAAQRGSGG